MAQDKENKETKIESGKQNQADFDQQIEELVGGNTLEELKDRDKQELMDRLEIVERELTEKGYKAEQVKQVLEKIIQLFDEGKIMLAKL